MASSGESNTRRNLAIASGVALGAGIAGVLAWRWGRQRSGPDREYIPMVWDPNLDPDAIQAELDRIAAAEIEPLQGRRFRNYLAVVATEAGPFAEYVEATAARPAVAIQERESGVWHVGVMELEGDGFGRLPDQGNRLAAAVHLGQPAIRGAVLAAVHDSTFMAFPTDSVEVTDITHVLEQYPDVPLLANHSIQD